MRILWLLLCVILAAPSGALAASDIVATYTYSDGTQITLCTRDATHVRMDTSPNSYMLLRGDKVYAVSRDDSGACQVVDMDQMKSTGGGFMSMFGGGSAPEYEVRYEKTGRTEKVAGYSGTIYTAVIYEDGKVVGREEVVLGSQADIKKLTNGWMAMAERLSNMGQAFGDSVKEARKTGYGGLLRYGDQMRLSRLKVTSLKSAYYDLPKASQQVQVPSSTTGSNDAGLSDDAKEIGQDAKEATKDEIKEGVRGMISDIFN